MGGVSGYFNLAMATAQVCADAASSLRCQRRAPTAQRLRDHPVAQGQDMIGARLQARA